MINYNFLQRDDQWRQEDKGVVGSILPIFTYDVKCTCRKYDHSYHWWSCSNQGQCVCKSHPLFFLSLGPFILCLFLSGNRLVVTSPSNFLKLPFLYSPMCETHDFVKSSSISPIYDKV